MQVDVSWSADVCGKLVRNFGVYRSMPLEQQNSPRYRFGPFEVCLETGELLKNNRRIHLQRKPFEVLAALLEHSGKLVSRESLRQRLWPADTFVDFDNGLNTALSKLRDALGDSSEKPRYIETFEGRGYRFLASVEELRAQPSNELRQLEVERRRILPDVVLVEIAGKVVYGPECRQIEWLIAELLHEGEKKIVFDISRVDQLDSTGVGILVVCSGKVKEAGGELRVAGAVGHVDNILKITHVVEIVRLYRSRVDALEGFVGTAA
jgi:anti-anti-sigma factor